MWHFEKHFTPAEANSLIPRVRENFRKIHTLLGYDYPGWTKVASHGNGNGKMWQFKLLAQQLGRRECEDMAGDLIRELEELGIIVRDWRRGLVDFPAVWAGREVFLCYELDDGEQVRFYHGLNEGYAGRRPLK
jgi:hypothetical protein